jgi:glyoxylase I family protein
MEVKMAIVKIDHVSILSKEPEDLMKFYGELLGFHLDSTREVPAFKMNVFNLKARGDYIEVIQPTPPGESKTPDGIKHVAFLSDDIEADFARMKEKGAALVHDKVQKFETNLFFFMKSPSGEFVEIIQYL